MSSSTGPMRRILSPLLALVLLSTGLTVPHLDRQVEATPSLRQVDEQTGTATPHDHSICIQVAANQGLTPSGTRVRLPEALIVGFSESAPSRIADQSFSNGYHSRAPPLV